MRQLLSNLPVTAAVQDARPAEPGHYALRPRQDGQRRTRYRHYAFHPKTLHPSQCLLCTAEVLRDRSKLTKKHFARADRRLDCLPEPVVPHQSLARSFRGNVRSVNDPPDGQGEPDRARAIGHGRHWWRAGRAGRASGLGTLSGRHHQGVTGLGSTIRTESASLRTRDEPEKVSIRASRFPVGLPSLAARNVLPPLC